MTPAFSSWSDFFQMGGYAFYVWLAVSITLVALVCLIVHTLVQRQTLLKQIRQRESRERRIRAAKQQKHAAVSRKEAL
ncbi:heme exporter protein CcmD [Tatumella saanichensis]|uniref:heme exporter protein CcmD n=1 Tax=Tatumella saanichensis TaxID=480813 RepID=UPI0004A2BC1F|nr:heme exporter protein CcmD [Tatumella saanichensis]